MQREHVIGIDLSKPLGEEPGTGHNRWHEAVEPVVEVDPGDTVVYETRDAFDGQLNGQSTAEDVGNLDLGPVHPLTGPVYVKGAEQGDLLEVELVTVEADPWEQWDYTLEVPGFGFLRDEFPDPYIIHWRLHGNEYAESEQLPGVCVRSNPHPGVLGLAPSTELRQRVTEREADVAERGVPRLRLLQAMPTLLSRDQVFMKLDVGWRHEFAVKSIRKSLRDRGRREHSQHLCYGNRSERFTSL